MSLLPREHGAYGQCAIPLITAFAVAGVSLANVAIAVIAIAGFLAHEPASILVGTRGARAKTLGGRAAMFWLAGCALVALAGGGILLDWLPAGLRWSLLIPGIPAVLLALLTIFRAEKSWQGEVTTAIAFAGTVVPMILTAGYPVRVAAGVAIPLASFFVAATLAVRTVIVRVRGGGDRRTALALRASVCLLTVGTAATLAGCAAAGALPFSVATASAPGLAIAAFVAVRPPAPARLRTVGWTLMATSVVTALMAIRTASL